MVSARENLVLSGANISLMKIPILIEQDGSRNGRTFISFYFFALVLTGGVTISFESENNSFLPFTEELSAASKKVFRVVIKRQMSLWDTLCLTGVVRLEIWKTAQKVTLLESEKS